MRSRYANDCRQLPSSTSPAENEVTDFDAITEWFARPVLHVSNVQASLRFYVDRLGFTVPWRVECVERRFTDTNP